MEKEHGILTVDGKGQVRQERSANFLQEQKGCSCYQEIRITEHFFDELSFRECHEQLCCLRMLLKPGGRLLILPKEKKKQIPRFLFPARTKTAGERDLQLRLWHAGYHRIGYRNLKSTQVLQGLRHPGTF